MSAAYYDTYAERQISAGTNARHHAISRWLVRFGLDPGMDILEVGCGIGTVSELIAWELAGKGTLTAVDLSPRSIEHARERVPDNNVRFIAADILHLDLDATFDAIVLPDVVEHIPLIRHHRLFARVRRWLRPDGWALIHTPSPYYLDWLRRTQPESLQEIDQPIYTDQLAAAVQANGLYIHQLEIYSIWDDRDYLVALLRPAPSYGKVA